MALLRKALSLRVGSLWLCPRCMVVPNKTKMLPSSSFKYIIQRNFVPLFTLATVLFIILYFQIALSAIKWAVVIGLSQSLLVIVSTWMFPASITQKQWWQLLFVPRPVVSLGAILLTLVGFITALGLQLFVVAADAVFVSLVYASLGFAAGTAVTWLLAGFLLLSQPSEANPSFEIDYDYIQVFAAAIIAAAFLGITLLNASAFATHEWTYAPVFVPLAYGIGSIFITLLPAYLADNNNTRLSSLLAGMLAALLLGLLAHWLVAYAFPAHWVKNGKEYTAVQLVDLWWVAIAAGYVAGRIEKVYNIAAKRYVDYLLNRPARRIAYNVLLHVTVNHIVAYLPTLLMITALAYAYVNGGIYGTAIAVLGTVSNLGTGKITVANVLITEHLQYLTDGAKRKLRLLSPPMAALIRKSDKMNASEAV